MSTSNWRRVNEGVLHVIWIMLVINLIYSGNMYTLPSVCEVTRKHSRWHSHSRRHDPKNASLTPDWICNLDSISSETRKKYWESSWWWQLSFPSTFSSTHWYARSSPELKKDNCPMWIESYIVSRYTCCLKQNNYILLIMSISLIRPCLSTQRA